MKTFTDYLAEALSKDAEIKDWIKDFLSSDAPQFKGKSKDEIIKMATAAYYSSQKNEEVAANSVAGGGVDMNPTGKIKKLDKRSRFAIEKMYKRSQG